MSIFFYHLLRFFLRAFAVIASCRVLFVVSDALFIFETKYLTVFKLCYRDSHIFF